MTTDTNQILHDLIARVDALEQRNDALEQQNAALLARDERQPISTDTTDEAPGSPLERMSRRWLMQRAAQATAATVAAGVLLQRTSQQASAAHSTAYVDAYRVTAHVVSSQNESGSWALIGGTASTGVPAVYGYNTSSGPGIYGTSFAGGNGVIGVGSNGVQGESPNPDASGVYGFNTGNGFGVAGDTTSSATTVANLAYARAGVFGRNNGTGAGILGLSVNHDGDGAWGHGKVGLRGTSLNGHGLFADGGSGYGGQFKGTRAQLRLTPAGRIGKPTTGSHQIGELYLDSTGTLFICTRSTTATVTAQWKQVNATVV